MCRIFCSITYDPEMAVVFNRPDAGLVDSAILHALRIPIYPGRRRGRDYVNECRGVLAHRSFIAIDIQADSL